LSSFAREHGISVHRLSWWERRLADVADTVRAAQLKKKEALVEKTAANLKLACDAGNRCACNALQSGNCECPDEPLCAGEVFWFVGSK
jgi:hypothetical protein